MKSQAKASTTRQILAVDDQQEVRDVLMQAVTNLGYTPLEASNVKEALAHITHRNVDLMLLDLHLGGAGGKDLLKVLHRRKWKVPTLVVSAYLSPEVIKELTDLGVLGIVVKPFKMDRLISEIQRCLSRVS